MNISRNIFLTTAISCFCIFSISLFGQTRKEWNAEVRERILTLQSDQKIPESIPYLERYLKENPHDIYYWLLYGRALLYRDDLPLPEIQEDIFTKERKWKDIRANYRKASEIFKEKVGYMEKVSPREPDLGRWVFLWAMAEWFAGEKDQAISLFRRAVKYDFTLNQSYFNIACIYQSLGQQKDAEINFRIYRKTTEELEGEF